MSTVRKKISDVDVATIRFAGDSGDGMQLTGNQFSDNTAIFGNDLATLPDFPAEIRAPKGSLAGVSSYQLQFSNKDIHTPGDDLDVLYGEEGDDILRGGAGTDYMYGDDRYSNPAFPNAGNDELYGEGGSDRIYGGAGDESLGAAAVPVDGQVATALA